MRLRTAATAATSVLGAATAGLAAGRYIADAVLRPVRLRPDGGSAPPAGFENTRLTVHSHGSGKIAVTRSLVARLPGTYALTARGTHAVVGRVLDAARAGTGEGGDLPVGDGHAVVVRELERVVRGRLEPGSTVRLTPQIHTGDPEEALGIPFEDVRIPGELGALPGWLAPGARNTWIIAAHGLRATREQALVVFPFYRRHHLPVLALAHRGDPGAPRPAGGINRLGDVEWRDLEAAIRYAVGRGAHRVILHGWSTGAAMALHAAAESELREHIAGLVLDSPVLDRKHTVRALAEARGTPQYLLPLVMRAALGRAGLSPGELSPVVDPARLDVPTLLLHGPADTIASWDDSRALAGARPELVSLHTVAEAPHAAMWNADPHGYEEALRRFITPLV